MKATLTLLKLSTSLWTPALRPPPYLSARRTKRLQDWIFLKAKEEDCFLKIR